MSNQDQIEHINPHELIPHPDNSMKHGDDQITQLVASFEQFGFNGVIVIDEDNVVLAGHGRRLAAIRAELATVNCLRRVGLSDAQKRAYIIADNKIGRESEWDMEVLSQQLANLADGEIDLSSLGIGQDAISSLFPAEKKKREGTAEQPVKPRRRGIQAISDVIDERERQISDEGFTPAHDDQGQSGALATAAVCYAQSESERSIDDSGVPAGWPWPANWWKPADRRKDLVRAAALLIAEIERLDRASAQAAGEKPKKTRRSKEA